jgi:hypothetical protein
MIDKDNQPSYFTKRMALPENFVQLGNFRLRIFSSSSSFLQLCHFATSAVMSNSLQSNFFNAIFWVFMTSLSVVDFPSAPCFAF